MADRLLEAGESGGQEVTRRLREVGREIDQEKDDLERTRDALRILEAASLAESDVVAALELPRIEGTRRRHRAPTHFVRPRCRRVTVVAA